MAEDKRITQGVLGDITPPPSSHDHQRQDAPNRGTREDVEDDVDPIAAGSGHDQSKHSGSRDVTEGTTVGSEVGGTRNYRTGTGAIGTDIGNRPE
jgi:hypothetical protein